MPGLIDVHHHFMSQAYLDAVGVERAASPGSAGHVEPWSARQSLEFMDMAGIDAAVISVSAPGIDMGTPQKTAELARRCNEEQAGMVAEHPRRFGSLAILPLPDIDAALREIAHAFDVLKADGVVMMSNYGGEYIGSDKFWPVFEELNRRKAVAFFHPVAPEGFRGFPGVSLSTMEFPFDTARAIMSMLYFGTPEKFPNVKMVFSHAGGAMPYLGRTHRRAVATQQGLQAQRRQADAGDAQPPLRRDAIAQRADLRGAARARTDGATCCSAPTVRLPRSRRSAPCSTNSTGWRWHPPIARCLSAEMLSSCSRGWPDPACASSTVFAPALHVVGLAREPDAVVQHHRLEHAATKSLAAGVDLLQVLDRRVRLCSELFHVDARAPCRPPPACGRRPSRDRRRCRPRRTRHGAAARSAARS